MKKITFDEHKEQTAKDCEEIADMMKELAHSCRKGDMDKFEAMWITGGTETEDEDSKMAIMRECIILRYQVRKESIE